MNGKKTIPLLVIASMILALLPSMMIVHANTYLLTAPVLWNSDETATLGIISSYYGTTPTVQVRRVPQSP